MLDGSKKTFQFFSYPAPIWLPKTKVRPRRQFLVWAMRRGGNNGAG